MEGNAKAEARGAEGRGTLRALKLVGARQVEGDGVRQVEGDDDAPEKSGARPQCSRRREFRAEISAGPLLVWGWQGWANSVPDSWAGRAVIDWWMTNPTFRILGRSCVSDGTSACKPGPFSGSSRSFHPRSIAENKLGPNQAPVEVPPIGAERHYFPPDVSDTQVHVDIEDLPDHW